MVYRVMSPPSTTIEWPVTYDAASEHNHTTASATSAAVPRRRMGFSERMNCSTSLPAPPVKRSAIAVSIRPGQTTLTRMLSCACSIAAVLVNPIMPCLVAT